jgi:flagellar transcriptional activator FlhD
MRRMANKVPEILMTAVMMKRPLDFAIFPTVLLVSTLFRLGLSEDSAAMIAALTPAQMMKIASGSTLLCRMRCDDDLVWGLLTSHGKSAANESVSRLHASILMAGRHQEAA